MKKNSLTFLFLAIAIISFSCSNKINARSDKKRPKPQIYSINEVLTELNKDLGNALADPNQIAGPFTIESINIELSTTTDLTLGGGIDLWVLSGGYERNNTKAYKTSYTIQKPQQKIERTASLTGENSKFAEYILKVLKAAQQVKPIGEYSLTDFTTTFNFTISNSVLGGAKLEFIPDKFGLNFDSKLSKEYSHEISIKFSKK